VPFPAILPVAEFDGLQAWFLAGVLLALSGAFATLRLALLRAVPDRVLALVAEDERRARIAGLLERAEALAISASALKLACDLVFLLFVLSLVGAAAGTGGEDGGPGSALDWTSMGIALGITVPVILFTGDVVASLVARNWGARLLARLLPAFHRIQVPVSALVFVLSGAQRLVGRLFGMRERTESERRIIAGLRQAIEESPIIGDLDETEREFILNVMEFRDVDAAEVMTPRTEIEAAEAGTSLEDASRLVAASGHSRIPVYRGNLDSIVGFFTARDVLKHDTNGAARYTLEDVMRPAYFVPETKRVSELLKEFRAAKLKLAVVLDEYGGTAGIVTMGDILGELVGDIPDEFDHDSPAPIRSLAPNLHEVDASVRVSEVNEALDLGLPEEQDFETLAGFVLSELGRFPKAAEAFVWEGTEFVISDASDRRVLKVRIRKSA
jgi:putative hemolysin